MKKTSFQIVVALLAIGCVLPGCARHQERPMITAVGLSPANRCDPPGIPYYLPKPLLVVAKNVRHIDESKVGLTGPASIPNGFDNQAAYADIKANVTVPNTGGEAETSLKAANVNPAALSEASPGEATEQAIVEAKMTPDQTYKDGLAPDSFFTYQVIFVPDLTQKYGLQISGGAGEFRAAMNMVNGWMYTGMGPFYMKDSSSAQNAMATGVAAMYAGRGVSDVVDSVGGLTTAIGNLPERESGVRTDGPQTDEFSNAVRALELANKMAPKVQRDILNYAEVYIYEPVLLPDTQTTEWRLVTEHHFDRHYFESADSVAMAAQRENVMSGLLRQAMGGVPSTGPPTFDQPNMDSGVLAPPRVNRLDAPSPANIPFGDSMEFDDQDEREELNDANEKSQTESATRIQRRMNLERASIQQRESAVRVRASQLQTQESAIRDKQLELSEREAEVRIEENGQNFAMGMLNRTGGFGTPPTGQSFPQTFSGTVANPANPSVVQLNVQEVETEERRSRRLGLRDFFRRNPENRPTIRTEVDTQRVILP